MNVLLASMFCLSGGGPEGSPHILGEISSRMSVLRGSSRKTWREGDSDLKLEPDCLVSSHRSEDI